jgi:hypothetical protein
MKIGQPKLSERKSPRSGLLIRPTYLQPRHALEKHGVRSILLALPFPEGSWVESLSLEGQGSGNRNKVFPFFPYSDLLQLCR